MSRNKTINVDNIIESKRSRKPKEVFVPEDPREKKRWQSFKNLTVPRRNRNEAISGDHVNRWNNYRTVIKRLVACLLKETHYREIYTQSITVKSDDKELLKIDSKILGWKQAILTTFEAIESENPDHKRWPALGEPDEEDMVEVADILCSRCNGEETPGNDILFCDRALCLRAYHQLCLDPPLEMANFDADQDWFCWQCECLDDCLDLLCERLNEEYSRWQDLFPEVREAASVRDTLAGAVLAEDEEEAVDADDEYAPTAEEMRAEEEELEDASQSGQSDDENNGEEGGENGDEDDAGEDELYKKLRALNDQHSATDDRNMEVDDEDNEEENDDDDDVDEVGDGELVSDLESDLDEDEVAGLLQDAAEDLDYLPVGPQMTSSTTAEPVARRLRDRSRLQRSQQTLLYGARDVGREIARVVRGVFVLGSISNYTAATDASLDNTVQVHAQPQNEIGLQETESADHPKDNVVPNASADNGSSAYQSDAHLLANQDDNSNGNGNHHQDQVSAQKAQPTLDAAADIAETQLHNSTSEPNTSASEEPATAVDLSACTTVESGCWVLSYVDGHVLETRDPSQVRYLLASPAIA